MMNLIENNSLLLFLVICVAILSIWFGWKIRLWWKNLLFKLSRKRGKKGEKTSIGLLERNGYKILDKQIKLTGHFFIDYALEEFDLRPDLLVEKDGTKYVAEIKTGEVASPNNRSTRRQLHEYAYYGGHDTVLLVDPIKKTIKRISFQRR